METDRRTYNTKAKFKVSPNQCNVTCISVKPFPNGSIKRKIGKFVVMSTGQIKSKSSSISFSSFPKIKRLTIVKTFSLFCVKEQTRIAAKTLSTVN